MTCTITDKLVTLGSDGKTRPMPRGVVYATPSAVPVYLNNQLLSNPVPTTQTDANGNWTLILPWQSESSPANLTWQIVLPDGTIYGGVVPAGQAGPFTIYQLVNSYSWTIQAGSGSTPLTTPAAATVTTLGAVQLDQNPTSGNPIAVTRNAGVVTVPTTPVATPNYGVLNLGPAPFDGSTSGYYKGFSQGAILAINGITSGSGPDLLRIQRSGTDVFRLYSDGTTVFNGNPTFTVVPAAGYPAIAVGTIANFSGGAVPQFQGTAYLAVNGASGYTSNLLDMQQQGVSKFRVDYTGALAITPATGTTAPAAGGAGALPATPAGYLTITINTVSRQIPYY